ncbi:hypothetical protein PuT2_12050 [Pusillimonas sp. T2]|uniref:hypothetical protein n=1 Tax=Pusillimonas sp. T2 TaxID=1548123 RepID=UPI000B9C99BD|nr:hypothetical protein [Pusillimonas sp. T2]OXR48693.1 hypothetical protein PuT2_12050 [Pusillimonas sp. T2]
MATVSFLNDNASLPGRVTRGLFGTIEPTADLDTVRFKLDPRLINVCTGMGTGLVNGAKVRAQDVHTIEIADDLKEAFCCSVAMGLLRGWSTLYLQAGMPMRVLDQLSQDVYAMSVEHNDLDLRSNTHLLSGQSQASMLTYDFMNAARTVVQFIQQLRDQVQLQQIPACFGELAYQRIYNDEIGEQEAEELRVYVGQNTRFNVMDPGQELEQIECLLQGVEATVEPTRLIDDVPEGQMIRAQGTLTLFVPRHASSEHVAQMVSLVEQSPLRSLLLDDTTRIDPASVRLVSRRAYSLEQAPGTPALARPEGEQSQSQDSLQAVPATDGLVVNDLDPQSIIHDPSEPPLTLVDLDPLPEIEPIDGYENPHSSSYRFG